MKVIRVEVQNFGHDKRGLRQNRHTERESEEKQREARDVEARGRESYIQHSVDSAAPPF